MCLRMLIIILTLFLHNSLKAAYCKMSHLNKRILAQRLVKYNRTLESRVKQAMPLVDISKRFYCKDQTNFSEFESSKLKKIDINQFNLIKDKLALSLLEFMLKKNTEELENFRKILGESDLSFEQQFQLIVSVLEKSRKKADRELGLAVVIGLLGGLVGSWLVITYFDDINKGITSLENKIREWKKLIVAKSEQ